MLRYAARNSNCVPRTAIGDDYQVKSSQMIPDYDIQQSIQTSLHLDFVFFFIKKENHHIKYENSRHWH